MKIKLEKLLLSLSFLICFVLSFSFVSLPLAFAGNTQIEPPPLVSTDWLEEHMEDENLVILEIRSGETSIKFEDAHIPNSVFASSVYFQKNTDPNIPNDIPSKEEFESLVSKLGISNDSNVVIVYPGLIPKDIMCATRTYWTFDYYGMTNISILDGGFGKWKREGRQLSNQIREPVAGNFTVNTIINTDLANLSDVKAAVNSKDHVLLDARMSSDYVGSTKQPFIPEVGHISGSINYFAPLLLNPDLTFKTAKQITYEMALLGITKEKSIITYCNSGQFATTAWFGLKEIAGMENVSSYDGSVSEWVNAGNLPLEADHTKSAVEILYASTPSPSLGGIIRMQIYSPKSISARNNSDSTQSDRILLPIGSIVEALGGTVVGDGANEKITISLNSRTTEMWSGSSKILLNGNEKALTMPLQAINGMTMVTLDDLKEITGYNTIWLDEASQVMTIFYQGMTMIS